IKFFVKKIQSAHLQVNTMNFSETEFMYAPVAVRCFLIQILNLIQGADGPHSTAKQKKEKSNTMRIIPSVCTVSKLCAATAAVTLATYLMTVLLKQVFATV